MHVPGLGLLTCAAIAPRANGSRPKRQGLASCGRVGSAAYFARADAPCAARRVCRMCRACLSIRSQTEL